MLNIKTWNHLTGGKEYMILIRIIIWNRLTVCKHMYSYNSFENKVTNKLFVYKS